MRLSGILRQTFDCGDKQERVRTLIETADGFEEVQGADLSLLNQPVEAEVTRGAVQSMTPANRVLSTEAPQADPADKSLAIFKVVPADHVPTESEKQELKENARKVEECLDYTTRGRWNVSVKGYFLNDSSCNPTTYNGCMTAINRFKSENGIQVRYTQTWGGRLSGFCGHAVRCSPNSISRVYSYCGASSKAHEFGHSLCMGHAGKRRSNGTIDTYGDSECFMGSGNMAGLNAPMQFHTGLHNVDHFVDLSESKTIYLAPIEWDHEFWPGESGVVRVIRGAEHYFISRRKWPYPYGVQQHSSGYVYVHKTKTDDRGTSIRLERLDEGEAFEENGMRVVHDVQGRDVSTVRVILDGEPAPDAPEPVRPSLPVVETPLSVFDIGYWRDPKLSGQGYELFVIPPRLDITHTQVLLYDYNYNFHGSPRRVWHYCDGKLENGVGALKVYRTEHDGGTMKEIGFVRLWREADRMVMDWHTDEHGRKRMRLERLLTAEAMAPELTGVWGAKDLEHQGITLQARGRRSPERGPILYGFWWTYATSGNQDWLELDGGEYVPGKDEYVCQLYRNSQGRWADPRPVRKTLLRQVRLRIEDDENLVLISGNTEIPLKRITPQIQTP